LSKTAVGSIFAPEFLACLTDDVRDPLTAEAHNEAATAGPWAVRRRPEDGEWLVAAEGQPDRPPVAVVHDRNIALLVAAAYPALGRRVLRLRNEQGTFHLETLDYERLGTFQDHPYDDMEPFLQMLEYLRRSPLSLAHFLFAARGPALEQAAQILWLWLQAPPDEAWPKVGL
jgi:hypothetical protein